MQYVNDDMDELFRRAAENYPLDTSGANWNKVLALMEGETGDKTVPDKKNNNRRFLWLLLLLPLGFVCNQLYTPGFLASNGRQPALETGSKDGIGKSVSEDLTKRSKISTSQEKSGEGSSAEEPSGLSIKANAANDKNSVNAQINKAVYGMNAAQSRKLPEESQTRVEGRGTLWQAGNQGTDIDPNAAGQSDFESRIYVPSIAYRDRELRPNFVSADLAFSPIVRWATEGKKAVVHVSKPKRLYAGLMGGLDATTIKLQKVENAGFSYGVLGGYQLNRKWSIEAGAYLEKKYYYSDGKYFNTSKIYMPANSRISEVSGDCKMIEVPVSARYIFSSQKGSKWFATLGLSSYFMTEENYSYEYYYGTVGPVTHNKKYTNGSTSLFSNISLSAGYIRPLGSFADLRIEPYFKLPMSGLGVGSLPLFSMGLQVGVTKKF